MSVQKPTVDYSLYLVTGRELLPEGKVILSSSLCSLAMLIRVYRIIRSLWKRCFPFDYRTKQIFS